MTDIEQGLRGATVRTEAVTIEKEERVDEFSSKNTEHVRVFFQQLTDEYQQPKRDKNTEKHSLNQGVFYNSTFTWLFYFV